MVLFVHGVFQVRGGVLELAQAGGGGVGKVFNDLLASLLSGQFLQLGKGFGLPCREADDKLSVYPSADPTSAAGPRRS